MARTSAEEELSALLSEEAEKAEQEAKVMRRRRLAAVGPYVMPADRRSAGWEICEMPELALVKKGLHIRSFMRGIEWRVAALFEDKWWDGTLLARLPKAHAKYPLYYSVRYTDGEVAYTPLVHADYGVDREWVIDGNVEGKLGPLPGKGPSRDLTLVGHARPWGLGRGGSWTRGKKEENERKLRPPFGPDPGAIVHFSTSSSAGPPKRIAARAASQADSASASLGSHPLSGVERRKCPENSVSHTGLARSYRRGLAEVYSL